MQKLKRKRWKHHEFSSNFKIRGVIFNLQILLSVVAHNIGFFGHKNFGNSRGKGQNNCCKLPKDRDDVSDYLKQGNLNGTNTFGCLHQVTKSPER